MKISVNSMVRNEPFIFHAIASVVNFVDEVIVTDTGSTDDTVERIEKAIKIWPDKVIFNKYNYDDAHGWVAKDLDNTVNWDTGILLGNVRREQHAASKGEYTWILDGDEVYHYQLADFVRKVIDGGETPNAIFLPFIDFVIDTTHIRQYHHMGRLFKKDKVEITGKYPAEMHRLIGSNKDLAPGDKGTIKVDAPDEDKVCHFESLIKPWRKPKTIVGRFHHSLPEVFKEYPDPSLEKYLVS